MSEKPNRYWKERIEKAKKRFLHFSIRCQTEQNKLLIKDLVKSRDASEQRLKDLLSRFNQEEQNESTPE